uniref:Gonadotropin-releasing hormone, SBGNRH-I n=1 Tax=Sparus aurata TaxID=8175 RepID=Q9PRU9_SPAAU|nr:gonadotropin-releasing hormone, sbGnRH-I [Sparus aurata=gilthead sea bream, brains, Peptide, 10 aa] [Sparus aurata]
GPSLGYSWHE